MNKLLNIFYILVIFFLATILSAQDPFLMVKPYDAPEFEQYTIRHHTDHSYPTQTPNDITHALMAIYFIIILSLSIVHQEYPAMMAMPGMITICH